MVSATHCHVKMETPYFGDPGSPFSYEIRDPGPQISMKIGTWGPQSHVKIGSDPLMILGTPSRNTKL